MTNAKKICRLYTLILLLLQFDIIFGESQPARKYIAFVPVPTPGSFKPLALLAEELELRGYRVGIAAPTVSDPPCFMQYISLLSWVIIPTDMFYIMFSGIRRLG